MNADVTRTIEVYADVGCPFTHVGLRRLLATRDELRRPDVVFRLRAWPLELVNQEPTTRELLEEEVAELRSTLAPDLFEGFDPSLFPMSTLPALALAERAYRDGLHVGEQVSVALREALFEQGVDVSGDDVLASIADRHGIGAVEDADRAAVRVDLDEGQARGVVGSPHFFVEQRGYFCPTLDIERVDGRLVVSFDREAFDAFVEACFG